MLRLERLTDGINSSIVAADETAKRATTRRAAKTEREYILRRDRAGLRLR